MKLSDYVKAMPKTELHIHLEGSIQPTTLMQLAERNQVQLPVQTVEELTALFRYENFDGFLKIFRTICDCLRTPADFELITYEYGRSMAEQNIRYAEVTFTPHSHTNETLTWEAMFEGIKAGRAKAAAEWGVQMQWIPDISRNQPQTSAQVTEWLISPLAREGGVVALGLGGPEVGFPPEMFEEHFTRAREAGLPGNPHAGETVGPESVWGAIRSLHAVRIGHGVRAMEDPALVAYLAEHQIPLEVNPTSNVCLRVYPTHADHPLKQLMEAGVVVTVNSDDPPLFNTTLNNEYYHAVADCGLSIEQLEQAALNAVRVSFLPETEKAAMLENFKAEYARLRNGQPVELDD